MGLAIVLASLLLLIRERWFLAETAKGRRLVKSFGDSRALWILRGLLLAVAAVGALLAGGIIRPVHW